jgi:hypothetical protein
MSKPILIALVGVALAIVVGGLWFWGTRDSKFPVIYNPANFVSAEEIHQIEQLIRARGERYIVSINIVNTNKAGATTGHGSHRPRSGRSYDLSRTANGWRIDSVEEWKN